MALDKNQIAKRIAQELQDGYYVTWGSAFLLWWRIIFPKVWMWYCKAKMDCWAWGLFLLKATKTLI